MNPASLPCVPRFPHRYRDRLAGTMQLEQEATESTELGHEGIWPFASEWRGYSLVPSLEPGTPSAHGRQTSVFSASSCVELNRSGLAVAMQQEVHEIHETHKTEAASRTFAERIVPHHTVTRALFDRPLRSPCLCSCIPCSLRLNLLATAESRLSRLARTASSRGNSP
jgi:hypothetical protein